MVEWNGLRATYDERELETVRQLVELRDRATGEERERLGRELAFIHEFKARFDAREVST